MRELLIKIVTGEAEECECEDCSKCCAGCACKKEKKEMDKETDGESDD